MDWITLELHQEHLNDLQRDAEKRRLLREAQADTSVNPVVGTAMVALGRQFVKLGTHLQAQYGEADLEITRLAPAE